MGGAFAGYTGNAIHASGPFVRKAVLFQIALLAPCLLVLAVMTKEERQVAGPAIAALNIGLALWLRLKGRDGEMPLFDVGFLCTTVAILGAIVPLAGYYAAGLRFTVLSDPRLLQYDPTPVDVGNMGWRFVVYSAFLAGAYSVFRKGSSGLEGSVREPDKPTRVTVFAIYAFLISLFLFLQFLFGLGYRVPYSRLYESLQVSRQLPLMVRQATHYLHGIAFILKLGLLVIVVQRCRIRRWRVVLWAWMAGEVLLLFLVVGARTETVLTLLAAMLLYHRLVRPLRPRFVFLAAPALFVAFSVYGIYREVITQPVALEIRADTSLLSAANEFQGMFANAYDLQQRKAAGDLAVPWQLYASEFLAVVPQQFLPFEKMDPASWYVDLLGLKGTGAGLMFGVIAQGIVGLDWVELMFRGAMLGFLLAMIHRWCARRSSDFFVTLLYLWLCVMVYLSFRGTTFSPVTHLVYEFLPAYLLIRYLPRLFFRRKGSQLGPAGEAA